MFLQTSIILELQSQLMVVVKMNEDYSELSLFISSSFLIQTLWFWVSSSHDI